jgi:hypothetical protein
MEEESSRILSQRTFDDRRGRLLVGFTAALASMALLSLPATAEWDPSWDDRHGVVATNTSGYTHPDEPYQGPVFFDRLSMNWWYNYLPDSDPQRVFPGYNKLYMYWRAVLSRSATQIQQDAADAKAAYPDCTIWWAMSNEPNDLGQANQSATAFADIYLHHHQNLRIGDPTCKIIGPGILNWDFESTSVWQAGRDWYEEFRNAWYANPTARAYSEANYGVSYPPQDGFNFHAYDLRGYQGTPWEPMDWRWDKGQIELCYADVLTYPEVFQKEIWLSEFGGLKSANMDENINHCVGLVSWMRHQPFMKRWVWFTIHSDMYWSDSSPPRLELLGADALPTKLGFVAKRLAEMPRSDEVMGYPATEDFETLDSYVRDGWQGTTNITDTRDGSIRLGLVNGQSYTAGQMRGAGFTVSGHVYHVSFDYVTNYDNARVYLGVDTSTAEDLWTLDSYGPNSGHVELDLPDASPSVGFCFCVRESFTYPHPTNEWHGTVKNVIVYYRPYPVTAVDPHLHYR